MQARFAEDVAKMQAERLALLEHLRAEILSTLAVYDTALQTFHNSGVPRGYLQRFANDRKRLADFLCKVELAIAGD